MKQREKQQQAAAADMIVNHHYETRYNDPNFDRKLDLVTFQLWFLQYSEDWDYGV